MALDRRSLLNLKVFAAIIVAFSFGGSAMATTLHIEHFKYVHTIVTPTATSSVPTGIRMSHDLIEHTNSLHDVRVINNEGLVIPIAFITDLREGSADQTYIRADTTTDAAKNQTVAFIDRRTDVLEHVSVEIPLIDTSYIGTVTIETSADNNHWTSQTKKDIAGSASRTLSISYAPTTDRFVRITLSGTNILASKLIGITSRNKYIIFYTKPGDSYRLYYGSNFATARGQKKLTLEENDLQNLFSATSTSSFGSPESKIGLRSDNPAYKDITKDQSAAILGFNEKFPLIEPILYILGSLGVLYLVYLVITKVEGSTKKKS